MSEEDLRLVPKSRDAYVVVEPRGAYATAGEGRIVTEIPGSTLPRAVIFRDSFTSALAPFLSEHFSRAVYLWQNNFDADDVLKEHADVVIEEIVGRHSAQFHPVTGVDSGSVGFGLPASGFGLPAFPDPLPPTSDLRPRPPNLRLLIPSLTPDPHSLHPDSLSPIPDYSRVVNSDQPSATIWALARP